MVSAGVVNRAVPAGSEILVDIDAAVTDITVSGLECSLHQGPNGPVKEGRGGPGALTNVVVSVAVPFKNTRGPPVPSANAKLINHGMPVEGATSLLSNRLIAVQEGKRDHWRGKSRQCVRGRSRHHSSFAYPTSCDMSAVSEPPKAGGSACQ